ncbi:hypothetical protein Q75_02075 [Bacillus coahuilensis p1.1.43]|uniref:YetF C-terminal domain-containing protein n=1 Tax=Bacillus coahuilensis p1.1.43 TaxID=1150625 RepID=A0A147KBQ8_9BACI|nr:DUF421 domain-containing protein [Bacillus coahuilensis]KUP08840.1 hypothetical protein Q75_02075 [Bacillus coahuilensis p1.1.43]
MEFHWIWKAVLIVFVGTILLRIAGRKSISQMTLAQTVIMIGIGSLLIQPLAGKNIWVTFGVGMMLVLTLVVTEYLQVKFDWFETFITGKSKIIIDNGVIQEDSLKKLRMTVDQLEMKLRQQSINKLQDVKYATLEPNGQVGVELQYDAMPATKKEIQELMSEIQHLKTSLNIMSMAQDIPTNQGDIFEEVVNNRHNTEPPDFLK